MARCTRPCWRLTLLAILASGVACSDRHKGLEFNAPVIGAPRLRPSAGAAPAMRDAGPRWSGSERLPNRLVRRFARLTDLPRAAPWGEIARLLRSPSSQGSSRRSGSPEPTQLTVTTFGVPGVPELYGVDCEAPCDRTGRGPFSVVEHHLLVGRRGGRLQLLTAHRPDCGSVGDRTIRFSDLLGEGRPQVIEVYTEDRVQGADFQEVRVFRTTPRGLDSVAFVRVASPFRRFGVTLEPGLSGRLDIVTTHLGVERRAGSFRGRPCWRYLYYQVQTRHRYQPAQGRFVSAASSRRPVSHRQVLDLTGSDLPGGTCGE